MLKEYSLSELGVLIVSTLGGIGLVISRIQHSRCRTCTVCCGLCRCVRDVPPVEPNSPQPDAERAEEHA